MNGRYAPGMPTACAICDLIESNADPGLNYAAGFAMGIVAERMRTERGKVAETLDLCADHFESVAIALAYQREDPLAFFQLNAAAQRGDA